MNSAPAAIPLPSVAAPGTVPRPGYALHSDLAQFCLPAATRDANRKLAYVNSICLLFLVVGLAGLNPPKIEQRVPEPIQEFVPVEIVQPPDPPTTEPQLTPDSQPQHNTTVELPPIATVSATH